MNFSRALKMNENILIFLNEEKFTNFFEEASTASTTKPNKDSTKKKKLKTNIIHL